MNRLLDKHDVAVAALILAVFSGAMIASMWGTWSIDMSAVWMAGRFAASGAFGEIYASSPGVLVPVEAPAWQALLAEHDGEAAAAFVYPPVWAFLAAPLAGLMDPLAFFNLTRVVTTFCFAASVLVAWRLVAAGRMRATAFAVLACGIAYATMPFQYAIFLNQPQLAVILLILLSFERYLAGRHVAAGVLLGVAAALKLSPILLVVIFASERHWRAVVAAFATSGAFMLASFGMGGVALHLAFLEQLRLIDGLVPMSGHNLTFETVMHDFFLPLRLIPLEGPLLIGVDTLWVGVVSKVLLVVSVVAVLWATRAEEFGTRVRQRLFLLYIAAIFFGPLAWIHYYVLPLLLLPGLALVARSPVLPALAILVVAGFSTPVMLGIHRMESGKAATEAFHAQHAAFFPLALFCLALPVLVRGRVLDVRPPRDLSAQPGE